MILSRVVLLSVWFARDQALLAATRSTSHMTLDDVEKNVDMIRIRSCKHFDKKTAVERGTATRKKKEEEERKKRKRIVKHKWVKMKTFTGTTSKFGGKGNSKKTNHSVSKWLGKVELFGGWGKLLKNKS